MNTWIPYQTYIGNRPHSVVGTLLVHPQLVSPQLGNQRDILVHVPQSYATGERRYPVLYMHDGQNLFDEVTSYAGHWRVDETLELLQAEGIEALVVGVPNAGEQRLAEYGPLYDAPPGKGQADRYLDFLIQTVKPLIDTGFRTLPDASHTGIMGSSMGGLISLYAYLTRPASFGFAGVMSPSLWFADGALLRLAEELPLPGGQLYLDVGTWEGRKLPRTPIRSMARDARRLRDLLVKRGYQTGKQLLYVEEPDGPHHESAWARRLPDALRFLLG